MKNLRKNNIFLRAIAYFIIANLVLTQASYADSLAAPKMTHPDANETRAISNLSEFEVCYGERLLFKGKAIPYVNYMLEQRYKARRQIYKDETNPSVKANLNLGPVEFLNYLNREGIFRFRNLPAKRFSVRFSAESGEYLIDEIQAANGSLSNSDVNTIRQFRAKVAELTGKKINTVWASDMDDTLTYAGSKPPSDILRNILRIIHHEPFLLISGLSYDKIKWQMLSQVEEAAIAAGCEEDLVNFIVGSNNGSEIYIYDLNQHKFVQRSHFHIKKYLGKKYGVFIATIKKGAEENDLRGMLKEIMGWAHFQGSFIYQRESQISLTVLGNNASREDKLRFIKAEEDPGSKYYKIRERVLVPYLKKAFADLEIEVDVIKSGLTSVDITLITKGEAISRILKFLIDEKVFIRGEDIYVIFSGDAFNVNDNDYPAISVADIIINVGNEPSAPILKQCFTLTGQGPVGMDKLLSVYTDEKFPADTRENSPRDIKGASAPDSNAILRDLIRSERVVEIYMDGDDLNGNMVEWVEKYVTGKMPPELYRGKEMNMAGLFSESELANLKEWMHEHSVKGSPVKFRIVLDESALGWRNKIENSNIAHAGYRDQCIYIGHLFIKYLMATGADREEMRADVLENDEMQHLLSPDTTDSVHKGEEYERRLKKVEEIIKRIEVANTIYKNPGYSSDRELKVLHNEALAMINDTRLITKENIEWLAVAYKRYLEGGPEEKKRREALNLKDNEVISYYSMEYAVTPELPFFAGGLGALAGDHGRAGSDLLPNKTMVCIGGYYEFGYLTQKLDETGWQMDAKEVNKRVKIERFGEITKDADGDDIVVGLPMPGGKTIYAKAWKVQAGRTMMLFLTSDIAENDTNPSYREYLKYTYDSNDHIRLLQEYIIGVGGELVLDQLGLTSRIIHLNEGHVAFAILEKARQLLIKKIAFINEKEGLDYKIETLASVPPAVREKYGLTLSKALVAVRSMVDFTSHTPVIAGNQLFPIDIARQYIEAYLNTFGASFSEIAFGPMVHKHPKDPACEVFDMTEFVLTFCKKANSVSRKHADVCLKMYRDTNKAIEAAEQTLGHKRPEFFHVTNAVSREFYQPPEMSKLLEQKLSELKKAEKDQIAESVTLDNITWADAERLTASVTDDEMEAVSRLMLTNGIKELEELGNDGHRLLPVINENKPQIDPEAFIVVFGRRMAGYKRADFILDPLDKTDMMAWRAIVAEAARMGKKIQIVYMGKAHDTDKGGKSVIQKILHIAKTDGDDQKTPRPALKGTILFVEDYNTTVVQTMAKIATAPLNNPVPPEEASGTSGMKFLLAGKPSVTVMDGWPLEARKGVYPFVIREDLVEALTGEWRYKNYAGKIVKGDSKEANDRIPSQAEEQMDGKTVYECLDPQCKNVWSVKSDASSPKPEKCPKCGSLAIKNNSYHELGLMDIYFNHKPRWYQIMRECLVQGLSYFTSHRMFNEYVNKIYIPTITSAREAENMFMRIGFDNDIKALRGNIKNGLKTLIDRPEFFTTGVTLEEFMISRLAKDSIHRTTSRDELKELEVLGLVEVDRSQKTYRYLVRSELRNLSPPERDAALKKILAVSGLEKRIISDTGDFGRIISEIGSIINLLPGLSEEKITDYVESSSDAGEYARMAAESKFPGQMHLVFVKKAIPDVQQKTTLAINVMNLCQQYYGNTLENYTVDIVNDHKKALELLAKNSGWNRNNTIIGLVDQDDLNALAIDLEAVNMTDKAKILSMQKVDDDQFVPIKPFFDLMATIVRINKPLDKVEDVELIDHIRNLLSRIGAKDIDSLTEVLTSADFQDPIKFAKNFIIRLLPPAQKFNLATLRELYKASKVVIESL